MANTWYGKGAQHFANGDISWGSNTIKVALVNSGYTPAYTTDEFFSVAVAGGNITSAGVTLGTKTNVLGKLSAANTTWTAVTGSQVIYLTCYVGGTAGSGDFLLFGIDTGTNLPVTPNGGDILATWNGTNGIATLFARFKDKTLLDKVREWLNDVAGIPATQDEDSGLWIPQPTITMLEPTRQQAQMHAYLMELQRECSALGSLVHAR